MTFKEWAAWLRSLPWALRWFPLLIVVRPLVDNLYSLKQISPLISPPYLVGVGTPLLCLIAVLKYRNPKAGSSDRAMSYWSVLLLLNALFLLVYDPTALVSIEFVLKLTMPVYLYFFLRRLITDLRDLHGVLQSFLYSGVLVAAILLYEVLVNPISIQDSRGLTRIQGGFGDVVSYGMYIIFTTSIAGYFFFARQHLAHLKGRLILLGAVFGLSLLALVNIHHTATYSIFAMIIGLFFIFNLRTKNKVLGLAMVVGSGIILSYFGARLIDEKLSPLVETDLAVYAGEQDSDRLFHGRVGRWRKMLQSFSSEPVHVQFIGYPSKFGNVYPYIGIGAHNDFLRILFATGALGLITYCLFLFRIASKIRSLGPPQRFLLQATLIALVFYSISVTPTFYAPFMYFALSIFAYIALPANKRLLWSDHPY